MPDPTLYLTDDTTAAVAALTGQTETIDPVTLIGKFKSGEQYHIVLGTSLGARANLAGKNFCRIEIVGNRQAINSFVYEYAKTLIRKPI